MVSTRKRGPGRTAAAVAALMLFVTACGNGGEPEADAEGVPGESLDLSIGGPHAPEGAPWVELLQDEFIPEVMDRVETETDHAISFTENWAGTVAGADEVSESVENGILDMGYVTTPAEEGRFPLHTFNYWLPFGPSDPMVAYEATRTVFEEFDELQEGFEQYNQRYLSFDMIQDYGVVATFPVESPDDIQGRQVGGIGPNLDYIKAAGGTGVTAAIPDMYTNIETGVMEGMIILPDSIVGQSMWEVADYWSETGFGALAPHVLTINMDTWESLPEDVQAIIDEEAQAWGEATAERAAESYESDLETWESEGGEIVTMSREEQERWAELLPEDYVINNAREVAGDLPAVELIQGYLSALEEEDYEPIRDWALD